MRYRTEDTRICPFCGFEEEKYHMPEDCLTPRTVLKGKYLSGKLLGRGGFGAAYMALDLMLMHPVAIKEFLYGSLSSSYGMEKSSDTRRQKELRDRERIRKISRKQFRLEARVLALSSGLEGIVQVHDFFYENDTAYIVMEYLPGENLKEYISRTGILPFGETVGKLLPIMNSLQYLHEQGILHGDLSPDNIRLLSDGTRKGSMVLCDFGGVGLIDHIPDPEKLKKERIVFRKDGFTSPEQAEGKNQGPWSDVFSMAGTIFFCVTGQIPSLPQMRTSGPGTQPKPLLSGSIITRRQKRVLLKALRMDPDQRYRTMEQFQNALRKAGLEDHGTAVRNQRRKGAELLLIFVTILLVILFCSTIMVGELVGQGSLSGIEYGKYETIDHQWKEGDRVLLGNCEQDGDSSNGTEPIEWVFVDVQGSRALLLSRYCLLVKEYDNISNGRRTDTALSWRSCTLRRVLDDTSSDSSLWPDTVMDRQDTMLYQWFSPEVREQLLLPAENVEECEAVLFLLSLSECGRYFGTESARRAEVSRSASSCLEQISEGEISLQIDEPWCWLTRTINRDGQIYQVDAAGRFALTEPENGESGIRPAVWVDLSSGAAENMVICEEQETTET